MGMLVNIVQTEGPIGLFRQATYILLSMLIEPLDDWLMRHHPAPYGSPA